MKRNVLLIVFVILISSCSNEIDERIEYLDSNVKETTEDIIKIASFSELTSWPEYVDDYEINPTKLLEWGKTPILNVEDLHEKGFTGKNIKVAIIDSAFNYEHDEFQNKEIYYDNNDIENTHKLHGTAVASILCGENIGIAPEVDLYYFGRLTMVENGYDEKIEALRKIRKYNEENTEPIRIVSISIGQVDELIHYEEFIEEIRKIENQGTMVFWVSMEQRIRAGIKYKLLEGRGIIKASKE